MPQCVFVAELAAVSATGLPLNWLTTSFANASYIQPTRVASKPPANPKLSVRAVGLDSSATAPMLGTALSRTADPFSSQRSHT